MVEINPYYKGKSPFIIFSLRHEVLYLFGIDIQDGQHDPAKDALYSMKLFLRYRHSTNNEMRKVRDLLVFIIILLVSSTKISFICFITSML